jgi:hypothetical protein
MPRIQKITKEDHKQILQWASEGETYANISRLLEEKITKQRVKQICSQFNIDSLGIRQNKKNLEQEAKMTSKWGKDWAKPSVRRSYLYQAMRAKYRAKKSNATRQGLEFTIEFGDLVFPTHCPIFGLELDYFTEHGWQDNSPSFDRINPNLGYVKGNVAIISMRANRIKNNGTAEEHYQIAEFMTAHSKEEPYHQSAEPSEPLSD